MRSGERVGVRARAVVALCAVTLVAATAGRVSEPTRLLAPTASAVVAGWCVSALGSRRAARMVETTRNSERRARAEWLHDTVCAEIRVARLRIADDAIDRRGLDQVLADLEHRVRLQQLDDSMVTGRVRLSEVVQPFIRRLQDHGVAVTKAPTFGESRFEIDEAVGRRLRHTLSVLVNNAILAGARGVSLRVELVGSIVEVEVADDAGGFDLHQVPAGRALDMLAGEVRSLNVEAGRHGEGIVVKVLIDAVGKVA